MSGGTLWTALGWTMLHTFWSGLLLGLLIAAGRQTLRGARPQVRYAFLCAGLGALALLPFAWFLLAPRAPAVGPPLLEPAGGVFGLGQAGAGSWLDELVARLPWAWGTGSSLCLLLLARGLAGTWRLRQRAAQAVERADLSRRCRALARELGIRRRVLVRVCDEVAGPVVVGVLRPLVTIPTAVVARCSPEQIEMVLLHELAHVRRWDNLVQLAQRLVQAAFYYQPAVWLVSSWIDLEREHCCDAVVLARTRRPRAYAQTLLALADAQGGAPALALPMAKRPLVARVERILRNQEPTGMQAKTTLLALTLILTLGWVTLAPRTEAQSGGRYVDDPHGAARCIGMVPGAVEGVSCTTCHVGTAAAFDPYADDVHAGIPAGTSCTSCHTTPAAALDPYGQDQRFARRGVRSDDTLERLRARERELQRLLEEVQRLRQELEALRAGAAPDPVRGPRMQGGVGTSLRSPRVEGRAGLGTRRSQGGTGTSLRSPGVRGGPGIGLGTGTGRAQGGRGAGPRTPGARGLGGVRGATPRRGPRAQGAPEALPPLQPDTAPEPPAAPRYQGVAPTPPEGPRYQGVAPTPPEGPRYRGLAPELPAPAIPSPPRAPLPEREPGPLSLALPGPEPTLWHGPLAEAVPGPLSLALPGPEPTLRRAPLVGADPGPLTLSLPGLRRSPAPSAEPVPVPVPVPDGVPVPEAVPVPVPVPEAVPVPDPHPARTPH